MKKYYSYVVISVVALFSVACGSTKKATSSTTNSTTTTAVAKPTPVVSESVVVAASKPQGVERKMKIVIAESTNSSVPQDIAKLVMPITEGCDQTTFVNFNSKAMSSPELGRLATPEAASNLSADITGGLSKNMSVEEFKQRYQRAVEEKRLDYSFVKPTAEGVNVKAAFDEAIKASLDAGHLTYVYAPNSKETTYKDVAVFNTVDGVRTAIAKELCVNKTTKEVVVYYEVPERFMMVLAPVEEVKAPQTVVKPTTTAPKPITTTTAVVKPGYDDKGNKLPVGTKWDAKTKQIIDIKTGKPYVVKTDSKGLENETIKSNTIEVKDIKK
jgi:hypothetical protein